jgi:hypothetical protein
MVRSPGTFGREFPKSWQWGSVPHRGFVDVTARRISIASLAWLDKKVTSFE